MQCVEEAMCRWASRSWIQEEGKDIPGHRSCQCKGPEAGKCPARASESLLCGYSAVSESWEGGVGAQR